MTTNRAAWLNAKQQRPFTIAESPMPVPEGHDVVFRVHAASVNPVDAVIQTKGLIVREYPVILGMDGAGEVVAIGPEVTRFKVGDRIITHSEGKQGKGYSSSTYQLYSANTESVMSKLPDHFSYAQGCVLPLCLSTAVSGLFDETGLGLEMPKLEKPAKSNGKLLFVWGGSSTVGSCAIQMGVAAGYEIAATASSRNLEYCKSLGATYAFDRNSETLLDDIERELKGKPFVGIYQSYMVLADMSKADSHRCAEVSRRIDPEHKRLGTVLPTTMPLPPNMPEGFEIARSWGDGKSPATQEIWANWLPVALENGMMQCKPDPEVVGQGLEKVQAAIDRFNEGVSAVKIVVEL